MHGMWEKRTGSVRYISPWNPRVQKKYNNLIWMCLQALSHPQAAKFLSSNLTLDDINPFTSECFVLCSVTDRPSNQNDFWNWFRMRNINKWYYMRHANRFANSEKPTDDWFSITNRAALTHFPFSVVATIDNSLTFYWGNK